MKRDRATAMAATMGALALLLVLLLPAISGHAVLLESDPAAGSRLDAAPPFVQVTLTESIDIAGSSLYVFNAEGERVDADDLVVREGAQPVLTIGLPSDLPDGAYGAQWVALSTVDGHTTAGLVGFAVGGFTPPESSSGDEAGWDGNSAFARLIAFLGIALVAGGLALHAMTPPLQRIAAWQKHVRASWPLGWGLHAVGIALLLVDGANDAGLALGAFIGSAVGNILALRFVVAAATLALTAIWWRRPVRLAPIIMVFILVAAAGLSARLGHGSQEGPAAIALDALHYLAAAAWVGALGQLLWVLRRAGSLGIPRDGLARIGNRFGTLATILVVATITTGGLLSAEILGAQLFTASWLASSWGLMMLAKWVGLTAMLALAYLNRRRYVRGTRFGAAHPGFPRTVAVEAILGVVVLLAAGMLTAVGAPQAGIPEGTSYNIAGDDFYGTMRVQPSAAAGGTSTLVFFLQSEAGALTHPDCGRDTCLRLEAGPTNGSASTWFPVGSGDGFWRVEDVIWTTAGAHEVVLEVQTNEVFLDRLTVEIHVT